MYDLYTSEANGVSQGLLEKTIDKCIDTTDTYQPVTITSRYYHNRKKRPRLPM